MAVSPRSFFRPSVSGGLYPEGFANDFVVVEVVLHPFDDLIILMSFARYEDDVARLCQSAGCTDGFSSNSSIAPLYASYAVRFISFNCRGSMTSPVDGSKSVSSIDILSPFMISSLVIQLHLQLASV